MWRLTQFICHQRSKVGVCVDQTASLDSSRSNFFFFSRFLNIQKVIFIKGIKHFLLSTRKRSTSCSPPPSALASLEEHRDQKLAAAATIPKLGNHQLSRLREREREKGPGWLNAS